MDLLRRSLVCLLILTLLSPTTLSMRFELHSDQMKCISEDIYEKSISVGKYFIVNPNEDHPLSASHKVITHRIQKPVKLKTLKLSKNIQIPKKTNFTQILSKEPKISTIVSEYQRYILKIFLKLETITKTRTQNLKKKISIYIYIYMMDLSVKKLFNTVESIHDEMYYLDREAEMQDLNRSTNSKMAWFSFLSLGVCLSVVGLQFWHLKSFFGKKKLI
ncbi:unnamed protein product [Brassica oleracea]